MDQVLVSPDDHIRDCADCGRDRRFESSTGRSPA
ncbi:hypothetical protein FrEUN1fDRAFT_1185 [Parafrankia sp. EUN1f]|nr:hypothetical protein FrEUN1fDRAFT_1185 [Parafrankia sp. EUN1f]